MKSLPQLLPRRQLQRRNCLSLFPRQFQEFAMPDMHPLPPTKAGASVHSPFQVSKIKV